MIMITEKVLTTFALGTHYGKAIVAPFNQEKDLVGAFSVIVNSLRTFV